MEKPEEGEPRPPRPAPRRRAPKIPMKKTSTLDTAAASPYSVSVKSA